MDGDAPDADGGRKPLGRDQRAFPNSRRATLLTAVVAGAVLVIVLASLVLAGVTPPGEDSNSPADPLNETAVESLVVEEVNQQRIEEGLDPVERESSLAVVARNHSADMMMREYYAHESPGGLGPGDRLRRRGIECESVGENIAATWYRTRFESEDGIDRHTSPEELAEGLVEQWRNSLSHRNNMLDPRWETTGVGIVVTPEREVIATQNFCEVEN